MAVAELSYSASQIDRLTTCPVCLDRFRIPKLLPCMHTFCLTPCLSNLVDPRARTLRCPECRQDHVIPSGGVRSFANNLTMIGFIDLQQQQQQNRNNSQQQNSTPDQCFICKEKKQVIVKCNDCSKFICSDCKEGHLREASYNISQLVSQIRRSLPKLSEKIGNYEQRVHQVQSNHEQVAREIGAAVQTLIDELKHREAALHTEAEVYMQSQLRTFRLQKESAEVELASVVSFCESVESSLTNNQTPADSDLLNMRLQCNRYAEQIESLRNQIPTDVQKLRLIFDNQTDISRTIQDFGRLINPDEQPRQLSNQHSHSAPLYSNTNSITNSFASPQLMNDQWRNLEDLYYSSARRPPPPPSLRHAHNPFQGSADNPFVDLNLSIPRTSYTASWATNEPTTNRRQTPVRQISSIFGPNPFESSNVRATQSQPPVAQQRRTISTTAAPSLGGDNRPIFGGGGSGRGSGAEQSSVSSQNRESEMGTMGLQRRNTFVLEEPSMPNLPQSGAVRSRDSVNVQELYNVRARNRAQTPVAFTVNLNESAPSQSNSEIVPSSRTTPSVDYSSKTAAKLTIGTHGKDPGRFNCPVDVAYSQTSGQILVADSNNHRIQIFNGNDGRHCTSFGGKGTANGKFDCVSGLCINSAQYIYVSDRNNHRVQIFDRYGRFIRTLGSTGDEGELKHPCGIAVDNLGHVYVCDKETNRIVVFHESGRYMRSFGTRGTGQVQFDKPSAIALTTDNRLVISDTSNHRIQICDPFGIFFLTFGSEGTENGYFKSPRGVTVDSEGFILVADSGNSRIQIFRSDGTFVCPFGCDGTSAGQFRQPEGLTVMSNGDVVIADKENHRIQIM